MQDGRHLLTAGILKYIFNILEAVEGIAEDQSETGQTRREAKNIVNKMLELEYIFMLIFWDEIWVNVRRESGVL